MNWKKYLARFLVCLWLCCIAMTAYHFREAVWFVVKVMGLVGAILVAWFGAKMLGEWVCENV